MNDWLQTYMEVTGAQMSSILRSAKYRARKILRSTEGRKKLLLYGERRFARDELERQEKESKHVMAFEKARTAALTWKRQQNFGRGGVAVFERKFVGYA